MVASSGVLLSPTRAPKAAQDRPHTSSSHTLASLGSPTQTRAAHIPNACTSPTSRRTVRACSALPFGFPSFGFPPFGFPTAPSQPAKAGPSGSEGDWIRTAGSPSGGCDSEADVGGVAAGSSSSSGAANAAGVHNAPSRRRLNLPSLSSHQPETTAAAAAGTATIAGKGPHDPASVEALPSAESGDWVSAEPGQQQPQQPQQGGGGAAGRRGSPLPYPWRLSEEDDLGGDLAGGYGCGLGPGGPETRQELDVRQLPQLLAQLSCGDDDEPVGSGTLELSNAGGQRATTTTTTSSDSGSLPGGLDRDPGCSPPHQPHRPSARTPAAATHRRLRQRQQLRRALLDQIHSGLAGGKLRAGELLAVPGLVPFLTAATGMAGEGGLYGAGGDRWPVVSESGVNASTGVALECLCTLLSEESLPAAALTHQPLLEQQLVEAVGAAVGVLRAARLPSEVNAPPAHNTTSPGGGGGGWADGTAAAYGWSADVSAAFFAASVLVRAARLPVLAEAAVAAGGLGLMVRLMGCRPTMLAQMAVFATYKLVRQPPPHVAGAAAFPHAAQAGCRSEQQQEEGEEGEGEQRRADRERSWREGALLAVAQCGGVGALCGCLEALEDRASRDMASSLMLDMALLPQVPAVVAGLNHVAPLVGLMGSRRCDPIARMYSLLVLARLANHSAECQMDAVREGAVEPLLGLVRRGCEEEQTHACRLLAILAQAVPTHGRMKALGVVQAVLPLLRPTRGSAAAAVVAEHACSVLAVLAQNPDMHFHLVGAGGVPALVPLLTTGTDKARTYVLASLMLLCEQEERHAAVVVRAGALPTLVAMVGETGATATAAVGSASPPHPAGGGGGGGGGPPQRGQSVASTWEFAAAVVCSLSRYVDVQSELLSCGALPALIRCLGQGPPESAINATEALVHLAAGEAAAKRAVARDPAACAALLRLLGHDKPAARYWSLQLLRTLSTDDRALWMAAGLPPAPSWSPAEEEGEEGSPEDWSGAQGPAPEPAQLRGWTAPSALAAAAASLGLRPPHSPPPSSGEDRDRGGASTARSVELVSALVRLLQWVEPEGQAASWQQGRCRVLAGWLLARMCGLSECAPVLLATGAVRELMGVLAEEQRRMEELAAAAAAAAGGREAMRDAPPPPPPLPLLSGGEAGDGGDGSGTEGDVDEEDTEGRAPGHGGAGASPGSAGSSMDLTAALGGGLGLGSGSSGGGGMGGVAGGAGGYPRRVRFDMNARAAAAAALLAVARTGRDGRLAVLAELALVQWMGTAVRLDELDRA
ncbi:hypothetical protein PLESTB_001820700 [Pleodorina starrii]|uniref:Vacuolar protein 8 n=1 Tax=Pleodorina starrii TaxID=330485 RepID=A0A9W6C1U8_9CHLO|nr:hypothetical protein PLESTM_000967900 [Pleodorina starrii]GLC61930.1 hypothetical protein PLESTB_001820700 [Pleodorina starrii]GLC76710.1 hypothetical protein PLESTF_001821000 [Pleodorina starrii]